MNWRKEFEVRVIHSTRKVQVLFWIGVALLAIVIFLTRELALASGALLGNRDPAEIEPGYSYLPIMLRAWSPEAAARNGLVISEVLYDPLDSELGGEWIEIYNPGLRPVDLTGYKIGDEELIGGNEGMLAFPEGGLIFPKSVLVIAIQAAAFQSNYGFLPDYEMRVSHPEVPTLEHHTAWAGGNVVLLNTSDEVLLLNERDRIIDMVSFGRSVIAFDPPAPDVPPGYSLERAPAGVDTDRAGDWRAQAVPQPGLVDLTLPTPTPTATGTAAPTLTDLPPATGTPAPTAGPSPSPSPSATPFQGVLLLSEVMYDPAHPEPASEWVEINNPGQVVIDLAGFKIGDEESRGGGEGMAAFPAGAAIGPGEVVLISREAQAFHAAYGIFPDFEFSESESAVPDMEPVPAWATGNVSLGNAGDEVLLLDPEDQPVDMVSWGNSDVAFEPPAPDVAEGHSLERYPADQDTDSASDRVDQVEPAPGEVHIVVPTETPLPETPTPTPTIQLTPTPTHTSTSIPTSTGTATPGASDHLLIAEVFYDTPGTDTKKNGLRSLTPPEIPSHWMVTKLAMKRPSGDPRGCMNFLPVS